MTTPAETLERPLETRIKEFFPDLHEKLSRLFAMRVVGYGGPPPVFDSTGIDCWNPVCENKLEAGDNYYCLVCDERREG